MAKNLLYPAWNLGCLYFILALLGGLPWGNEIWRLTYPCLFLVIVGFCQWRVTGEPVPKEYSTWIERFTERTSPPQTRKLFTVGSLYVLMFGLCGMVRSRSFDWNAFDLSYIDAAIYSTAKGYGFLGTQVSTGGSYLGEHFAPILALLSPFYWVFHSTDWLFFFQPLVVFTFGLILFYWAKNKHSVFTAWLVLFFTLFYQPTLCANEFSFREDYFFLLIGGAALVFYDLKKWPLFFGFLLGSLLIKENAAVLIFSIGILAILDGKKRLGAMVVLFSVASFFTINHWVTPLFVGSQKTVLMNRFPGFSGGTSDFIKHVVTHPLALIGIYIDRLLNKAVFIYLFKTLFIFLPILCSVRNHKSWYRWAALFSILGANVLVREKPGIGFHYELILLPILGYLVAEGLMLKTRTWKKGTLSALLFVLCFFDAGYSPMRKLWTAWPTPEEKDLGSLLDQIPSPVRLASTTAILPRIHHRPYAAIVGLHEPDPDFLVLSPLPRLSHYGTPSSSEIRNEYLKKGWSIAFEKEGVLWVLAKPGVSSEWTTVLKTSH